VCVCFVCICVLCMHACMCIRMYACVYIYTCMYIRMYARVYIYLYIRKYNLNLSQPTAKNVCRATNHLQYVYTHIQPQSLSTYSSKCLQGNKLFTVCIYAYPAARVRCLSIVACCMRWCPGVVSHGVSSRTKPQHRQHKSWNSIKIL